MLLGATGSSELVEFAVVVIAGQLELQPVEHRVQGLVEHVDERVVHQIDRTGVVGLGEAGDLDAPFPQSHDLRLSHNGDVIDTWQPQPIVWEPAGPTEFQRIRFASPYPTLIAPEADLVLELGFLDRPFPPTYPAPVHFGLANLEAICQQVDLVVSAIEAL